MTLILDRSGGRRNEEKFHGKLLYERVGARRTGDTLVCDGDARGCKKPGEILSWNTLQERIDHPSEKCWNAAAERDGLELDVHSTVLLLKSPIAVEAPQKATIFADGLFPFVRSIRVFHLSDPRGVRPAVYAIPVHGEIRHIEFCVEHRSDNCFLVEPHIDFETIPVSHQQFRVQHIRLVDDFVMIVVL